MKLATPSTDRTVPSSRMWIGAVALVGVTLVAGCTGSSSGGTTPSATSTRPSTASTDPTPVNTGTVKPPKHVIVYRKVPAAQAKKLEPIVGRAPGVQSVGYVPTSKQLSIYPRHRFTKKQRKAIKQLVGQTLTSKHTSGKKHRSGHHKKKH